MVEPHMKNPRPEHPVLQDIPLPRTQTFNLCSWRGNYQAKRIRYRRKLIYLCLFTATSAAIPYLLQDYQHAVLLAEQQRALEQALTSTQQVQQRSILKPLQQQWATFAQQRDDFHSQIQRSLILQQPLLSPKRQAVAYQSLQLRDDKAVLQGTAKHEADIIWLTSKLRAQDSVKQVVVNNIHYQEQQQRFTMAVYFRSLPGQQPNDGR